ncbi:MAG TPA: DUF998 domain-containing protein [Caulobacteraceae bacterium]|jgi:hypothetical membrane protein
MTASVRLWFGALAALIFAAGVWALASKIPGYSHVHQTISEIGEAGTPLQRPFTVLLLVVAFCMLVFASGVFSVSKTAGRSTFAAWLLVCMAASAAGVGIFSTPHPLHNVFGLSELVGYQAPAAVALTWRREPRAGGLVAFSWLMFVLLWVSMGLNLAGLAPDSDLWKHIKPVYGLAQRALFGSFFLWCAAAGPMLARLARG